jgi:hypothetical protein
VLNQGIDTPTLLARYLSGGADEVGEQPGRVGGQGERVLMVFPRDDEHVRGRL